MYFMCQYCCAVLHTLALSVLQKYVLIYDYNMNKLTRNYLKINNSLE